jgi:hypothetical protein
MALPNVPYAATTSPQMVYLDQTFAAVAALGCIPCTAGGTANAVTLTGLADTPSLSAYANHQQFSFVAASTPNGDVTVQFAGLGTVKLYRPGQPSVQVTADGYTAGALLVVAFNSALDSGNGGFQLVSAVQPSITPATAAQARAATDGSTALTSTNVRYSPFGVQGAITFASGNGPTVSYSDNLRVSKTGIGTFNVLFTSTSPQSASYSVVFGPGQACAPLWASIGTSGILVTVRDVTNSQNIDIGLFSVMVKAAF